MIHNGILSTFVCSRIIAEIKKEVERIYPSLGYLEV